MLEYTEKLLYRAGCSRVVVSGEQWGGIKDVYSNAGPLGAIYSVFQHCQGREAGSRALILPIDMPLLQISTLKLLVEQAANVPYLYSPGSFFPMLLEITEDLNCILEAALKGGESNQSIRNFLVRLNAVEASGIEPMQLVNTNTPEEWKLASQRFDN